ncbi:MAG: SGNH/GDSL hydrolase family protein [Bdellovibrionales bacterium]|nr:SGNH/GDSL hydrolase family protein [Bdellovibrionales bacterium]
MKEFELKPHSPLRYIPKASTGPYNKNRMRNIEDFDPTIISEQPNTIAVIGDSLAYGLYIKEDAIYTELLSKMLRNNFGQRDTVVLNLGVPGYSIDQIIPWFEQTGVPFHPKHLIYHFWFDDLYTSDPGWTKVSESSVMRICKGFRDSLPKRYATYIDALYETSHLLQWIFALSIFRDPEPQQAIVPPKKTTVEISPALQQLFLDLKKAFRSGEAHDLPTFEQYYKAYVDEKLFQHLIEKSSDLMHLCEKFQMTCTIILTPVLTDATEESYPYSKLHEYLTALFSELGFTVIDMQKDFFSHPLETLRARAKDPEHFNAVGHQLVARRLFQFFQKNPSFIE